MIFTVQRKVRKESEGGHEMFFLVLQWPAYMADDQPCITIPVDEDDFDARECGERVRINLEIL